MEGIFLRMYIAIYLTWSRCSQSELEMEGSVICIAVQFQSCLVCHLWREISGSRQWMA